MSVNTGLIAHVISFPIPVRLLSMSLLSVLISILLKLLTAEAELIVTCNRPRRNQSEREHWSFEPDSSDPVTPFRLIIVIFRKSCHGGHDRKCKKAPRHGARPPDPYRAGYFFFWTRRKR